jgi:hypothetical protein
MLKRAREPRLSIEGVWAEYIPEAEERPYSIGQIYFDGTRGTYLFNGTNFRGDGDPYCYLDTVTSHIDTHEKNTTIYLALNWKALYILCNLSLGRRRTGAQRMFQN